MVSNNDASILLELNINNDGYKFTSNIDMALDNARLELLSISKELKENEVSLNKLTLDYDKTDYVLAACSGALCGILDIFLVGSPNDSLISNVTDEWFEGRVKDFAKLCGWQDNGSLSSAIRKLENVFNIPYDQRGAGDIASWIYDLKPGNHHFKSLGHNPTLLGLFFSILDQFCNTSHFVSDGNLLSLQEADGKFVLQGGSIPAKLFCGFSNWFGHLISDVSGSSGGKGRGMGIPSPFWSWTNDVIAIKKTMRLPVGEFDKTINKLAVEIYEKGFDVRFQATQAIPVFVNELIVRTMYSVRRLMKYFVENKNNEKPFSALWTFCEPFSNASVKRMLTVAHGTFCLIDAGDATLHGFISSGGTFDVKEFFMRLNIAGVGRFTISLYGEGNRVVKRYSLKKETVEIEMRKQILEDYIEGLKYLTQVYDDQLLLSFAQEFEESNVFIEAFDKSVQLARKRGVSQKCILSKKSNIDSYFNPGGNN